MAVKTTSFKYSLRDGQFAPDWGGQLRPDRGDHIDRIFHLASDAAKYVTGVVLPVDGGNSIGF